MFQFLIDALSAWNQVLALLMSVFFLSVGALLLGNRLHWRLGASPVQGTVIGVRETGGMYYAVYHYNLPDGASAESNSDVGMSACAALKTGRPVKLLVFPRHPGKVMDAGSYYLEIFGLIFAICGGFVLRFALTAWPITDMTWVVLALFIGVGIRGIIGKIKRRTDGSPPPTLRKTRDDLSTKPVRPIESVLDTPEKAAQLEKQKRSDRIARPVMMAVGIGLLALAAYTGERLSRLTASGLRAQGTVEQLELDRSSSHGSYFPVVQFIAANGAGVRFRDSSGSNPPSYHVGEKVAVLYLVESPSGSATIDRGIWNWALPAGLGVFGVILIGAAWRMRVGSQASQ